jgi:hypothetical protein
MQPKILSKLQVKQALRNLPSIITARDLIDYFELDGAEAKRASRHLTILGREGYLAAHKRRGKGAPWEWRNLLAGGK